ncbi:MAG: NAD-dependent epimerase/dehydratase family protein [Candidatus Competibacteraceae bacterium]|jgi:uncharacterized protein YbjT (DUF2867 family)|nr:NAD-dependent epimerase/dehydratase family protein [Candidatus Competibacteraceae bacterium]
MNNTAIVIGATGLVGSALVSQLANANHISKVITITRRPVKHFSPKVFNHVVDFDRLKDNASVLSGDYLFSCLGTTCKQAGSVDAQRKVDLDYQFTAAQLAAKNGVQHYLLVSSSGANEKSNNPYLKMKGELEKKIQSLPFERISIFQPSLLVGDRTDFRLGEMLGKRVLPVLCVFPGLRRYRPIHGEQVAVKMIQVSRQSGNPLEWFRLDELFTH